MSKEDLALAVDWAAHEGWNPGLEDVEAFYAADPGGYLMAYANGEPAASISIVRYGESFAFLGLYITRKDLRGQGIGHGLWRHAIASLGDRTIGLDGVVEQQPNYRKSGFEYAHRNVRMSGISTADMPVDQRIATIGRGLHRTVVSHDREHFPEERENFLKEWLAPGSASRRGFAVVEDGDMKGYGTIRACRDGFKIGPLFAEGEEVADLLFRALAGSVRGQEVILDIPEPNAGAQALAERYELSPVFETARMYKGKPPKLPLERIFGITTFELG
ncbi:GNAT family N-acetyltransferase [Stappia albiluteola]|nr:GNAT family N-acetyltransferase [Stappia albiluteola]